jgi:formylglycine-generating enzyme required for sulfatase activity
VAAGAGAAALVLIAGIVLSIRTDKGTIEIRLNDPAAKVDVQVDGDAIHLSAGGKHVRLEVGEHNLLVKGEGYETVTKRFTVKRGENPILDVELKPEPVRPSARAATIGKAGQEIILNLGGGLKLTFVRIPAAGHKFWMGSPAGEPQRKPLEKEFDSEKQVEVEFTHDYYMAIHETTQAHYVAVTGKQNPSWFSPDGGAKSRVHGLITNDFPVERVSWDEAQEFCKILTAKKSAALAQQLGVHQVLFGLPTEAEWEYACRGGDSAKNTQPFYFKDGPTSSLSSWQANFEGNFPYGGAVNGGFLARTTAVGSYEANRFGLYDMHGNVHEWCADYYGPMVGGKDPERKTKHNDLDRRVIRGGSCLASGNGCRAAQRGATEPGRHHVDVGFRVSFRPR